MKTATVYFKIPSPTDVFIGRPYLLSRNEEAINRYKNPDNDPRGPWKIADLSVKTYSAKYDYSIKTPSGRIVYPPRGRCWVVSKETLDKLMQDNRIWFGQDGNNVPSLKKFLSEVKKGVTPLTIWKRKEVGDNQEARRTIRALFNDISFFDTPKSIGLINRIATLTTKKNDIILDFFSGSATTAHAVMQLNAEDGGNRKYIMVQLPEPCPEESEAYKAGFKNISEIGKVGYAQGRVQQGLPVGCHGCL
jgi:adenine-specific DNA-methyltransferase